MGKEQKKDSLEIWVGRDLDGRLSVFSVEPSWTGVQYQSEKNFEVAPASLSRLKNGDLYRFVLELRKAKKKKKR